MCGLVLEGSQVSFPCHCQSHWVNFIASCEVIVNLIESLRQFQCDSNVQVQVDTDHFLHHADANHLFLLHVALSFHSRWPRAGSCAWRDPDWFRSKPEFRFVISTMLCKHPQHPPEAANEFKFVNKFVIRDACSTTSSWRGRCLRHVDKHPREHQEAASASTNIARARPEVGAAQSRLWHSHRHRVRGCTSCRRSYQHQRPHRYRQSPP